jgi:predicted DCC family thiol-disulfide oxidoreductase YuxK
MGVGAKVGIPPDKPLLIFDGDCGFCSLWVGRWEQITGDSVDYLPAQTEGLAARFPEIPRAAYDVAVQLVEPDGRVYAAAEAVLRSLAHAPHGRWPLRAYQSIPFVAPAAELGYRFVAGHRRFFSRLTRWLWGRHVGRTTHDVAVWLFLRALALVYLVAFLSLWSQIQGLLGHDGILPVARLMPALDREYTVHSMGLARYRLVPTLCWLATSDGFLSLHCAAGTVLSLALLVGFAPRPSLVILWLLYLSLATAGREFLGFQWDNLLLEASAVALCLAPAGLWPRPGRTAAIPRLGLWLGWLLLFKLMVSSGCVKLASHDSTWRDLTALSYHYQTQPLPNGLAWYANRLPLALHKVSCLVMFAIELGVPFLIFAPRRLRTAAAVLLVSLQLLILGTGNYTFFNGLTLALCLLLVDDVTWRSLGPRLWRRFVTGLHRAGPARRGHRLAAAAFAIVFVPISVHQILASAGTRPSWLSPVAAVDAWLSPLRTISGYGLFAVMTTERREIIVEGSDDGEAWQAYEFKHKPGDPMRRPDQVAPHQPRLDWQMWFAALGEVRDNRWFVRFCVRLLEGAPPVTALLSRNPFPTRPPRFVRAELYRYEFTEAAEHAATGAFWHRERLGAYLPRLSLADLGR